MLVSNNEREFRRVPGLTIENWARPPPGHGVPFSASANPVRAMRGLGIGQYQAARHAESSGYALTLAENRDGEVCFVLRRPA